MAYKLERFATRWVEGVTKLYLKLIPIIGILLEMRCCCLKT